MFDGNRTCLCRMAGLFEGQTDEDDMGVKYSDIDNYLFRHKETLYDW